MTTLKTEGSEIDDYDRFETEGLPIVLRTMGDDWISEHKGGIYDSFSLPDENGDFDFYLLQSDTVADCEPFATEEEAIEFLSNPPPEKPADHCTTFLCNVKTGEVKVIEHY